MSSSDGGNGRIVAPYGVYGWLKVLPDTEALDGLFDYDTWWIGKTIGVKSPLSKQKSTTMYWSLSWQAWMTEIRRLLVKVYKWRCREMRCQSLKIMSTTGLI